MSDLVHEIISSFEVERINEFYKELSNFLSQRTGQITFNFKVKDGHICNFRNQVNVHPVLEDESILTSLERIVFSFLELRLQEKLSVGNTVIINLKINSVTIDWD